MGLRRSVHPGLAGDKLKLIVALSLLLSIGFAATALVNYFISRASIHESITQNELPLTSDNIYSEIQKDLVRPVLISALMASDTFVRDWVIAGEADPASMVRYLREVKERFGAFTSFFVSDRTLIYYQTEGVLKKVSPDEPRDAWYFRVREMEAPYELNVDPDAANRDVLTIFINYRVFDYDGRYIGATGVGLTVDAVRALVERYQQRYRRDIFFTDRHGNIALYGGAGTAGTNIRTIDGLGALAERILSERAGTFKYVRDGRNHLLNVRFIPELDWHLFVEQSADEAIRLIRQTLYVNLAISALITLIVLLLTSFTINRYQRRLEEMAVTDKLTGLGNRQAFDLIVPQAMREALRSRVPVVALVIDIDHFKAINDRYGHGMGDSVIAEVGQLIRTALRKSDIVCRWGGEEFLVVLKDVMPPAADALAEKIRRTVEAHAVRLGDDEVRVTVSIGIAVHREGESADALVARADGALYGAKQAGRNRVQDAGA